MRILVTGGTGTVGREVVRLLLDRGERPRVLTRSTEHAAALPAGVQGVVGDLARPHTLTAAFDAIDRVVLITALSATEAEEGVAGVEAAQRARVDRIAFMSVYDVDAIADAAHFASKIEIEQQLASSGLAFATIAPNNFFQNDLEHREALVERGVYPQPIGQVGLHRVDARDAALALVNVTLAAGRVVGRYPVVGADSWTGDSTAEVWSRCLGRPVRYGGDDLDRWAAESAGALPPWMIEDLAVMYGAFQERGLAASDADRAATVRVLGQPPRRFEDFARETALHWTAAAGRIGPAARAASA
jgi:uncharacterized protein YbjT (DUF2867 family)